MNLITLVGLDLAKNIFRINAVDKHGNRVLNKNIHRDSLVKYLALHPACTVAMEACATSYCWGRIIESLGHEVTLIHPRYVTPFRLGDKNDANDAAAICVAAQRPDMHLVRVKTQHQSDIQSIHRVRGGLVKEKTATLNRARSLLAENGIVLKKVRASMYSLCLSAEVNAKRQ